MVDPVTDLVPLAPALSSPSGPVSDLQTAGAGSGMFGGYSPATCPQGPHRGPQGPNEDIASCYGCGSVSWSLRPEWETFGEHLPDCSLPRRHESYCQPGGAGHPRAEVIRG